MKKFVSLLSVVGLTVAVNSVWAQGTGEGPGPGPQDPPKGDTEGPKDFAHYYSYMWAHEYAWADWLGEGNAFKYGETKELGKQQKGRVVTPEDPNGPLALRKGKAETTEDVQVMVQKFQQDRQQLMSQLKTANEEQRKEILQQMEQIRAQLREQLAGVREQALQQAEQMRNRFGNNRDRVLDQGTGDGGSGNGRDR